MRVKIELTVEVNTVAWAETYGVEFNRAAIRQDVKSYVAGLIDDSAAASECELKVV